MMENRLDLDSPQFRHELIRTLIQNTPVAYRILDKSFNVRFVNDYLLHNRKQVVGNVLGKKCYDITTSDVPCPNCVVKNALESGRPAKIFRKDILPDGTVTYADDFAIPIKNEITGDFDYILEIIIDRTKEMQLRERNNIVFLDIINAMIKLLEKKDYYTCMHSRSVSIISAKLTQYCGLKEQAVFHAALGGLLHDLGKLYIPDNIINKNGKLDSREYTVIKEHPLFAWLLLTGLISFNSLREVVIAHHEKWDGTGYPNGMKGNDIPIEARITAIADAYDAMTTDRPYRVAMSHEFAVEEIKRHAGTQFDPDVVAKFVQMLDKNFPDRDALVSSTGDLSYSLSDVANTFIHKKTDNKDERDATEAASPDAGNLDDIMRSDSFIESIFNNTPAFYTVVDENFSVLYASENLVAATGKPFEELINGKCFDMTEKKMQCFRVERGCVLCPVVRAFNSGKEEYALLEEDYHGQKLYFDIFAIPIELKNIDGEKIWCCLEIMFDRTREKNVQYAFESDLKHLLVKIRDMVEEILPDVSTNVNEIIQEANNFGEYLDNIKSGLSELVSTS